MARFAIATLAPLALIALGAVLGGPWAWFAVAWMTVLTATLDRLASAAPPRDGAEFPAGDALSVTLGIGHLALLPLVIWALALAERPPAQDAALFLAAGLFFGQVSNSNAHELIHRSSRRLRRLGVAVYVSLLFGHHASAHPLVHHVRVGTRGDPATARLGESFWRYLPRAWRGGFREGLAAETARRARSGARGLHPYAIYVGGALLCLALAASFAGPAGLAWSLALAGFAQSQLILSDYVQHYGLTRRPRPDGRLEPVGPQHSWNAPHPASAAMMLNAPRHSDHHLRPGEPYPRLTVPDGVPMLPRSLPVMASIALLPRLWRRVMDPRVARVAEDRSPPVAAE